MKLSLLEMFSKMLVHKSNLLISFRCIADLFVDANCGESVQFKRPRVKIGKTQFEDLAAQFITNVRCSLMV